MVLLKFNRRIHKIGNSLALVLPKDWCKSHQLDNGSSVILELETNGDLKICKN